MNTTRLHYAAVVASSPHAYLFGFANNKSVWIPKQLCFNHNKFMCEVDVPTNFYKKKLREMNQKDRRTPIQRMIRGI